MRYIRRNCRKANRWRGQHAQRHRSLDCHDRVAA